MRTHVILCADSRPKKGFNLVTLYKRAGCGGRLNFVVESGLAPNHLQWLWCYLFALASELVQVGGGFGGKTSKPSAPKPNQSYYKKQFLVTK